MGTLLAAREPYRLHARSFTSGATSFTFEGCDKIGGLQGLEPRHPFTDRRLVEFLMALPLERKGHWPMPKTILRTAMQGLQADPLLRQRRLPHPGGALHARILQCHSDWLHASVELALRQLRGYINVDVVRILHARFRSSRDDQAREPLWDMAVLADWMKGRGFGG